MRWAGLLSKLVNRTAEEQKRKRQKDREREKDRETEGQREETF